MFHSLQLSQTSAPAFHSQSFMLYSTPECVPWRSLWENFASFYETRVKTSLFKFYSCNILRLFVSMRTEIKAHKFTHVKGVRNVRRRNFRYLKYRWQWNRNFLNMKGNFRKQNFKGKSEFMRNHELKPNLNEFLVTLTICFT